MQVPFCAAYWYEIEYLAPLAKTSPPSVYETHFLCVASLPFFYTRRKAGEEEGRALEMKINVPIAFFLALFV